MQIVSFNFRVFSSILCEPLRNDSTPPLILRTNGIGTNSNKEVKSTWSHIHSTQACDSVFAFVLVVSDYFVPNINEW